MPLAQWVEKLESAAWLLGEPHLPLDLGASLQIQHMGLAGQLFLSCATYGEGTERVRKYLPLIGDVGTIDTARDSSRGEVHFGWFGEAEPLPVLAQVFAGAVITITQWLTGRRNFDWEFHFQFPAPADVAAYARVLGPRVRFGQRKTRAIVPAWVFDLPLPTQNADLRPWVEARAAESLRAMVADDAVVERVRRLITQELASGDVSLEFVAARLSLSRRTLNRRLAEAGCSFRSILESVREVRAKQLLLDSDLPLTAIADALGFKEQSAFQHAFRKWTGVTPLGFRGR